MNIKYRNINKQMKIRLSAFVILVALVVLVACKKSNNNDTQVIDCTHNNFVATIVGSEFEASELFINTNYCAPGTTCPFTEIYACTSPATAMFPPYSNIIFHLLNSTTGTYYLGKLGTKRDSVNYFTGDASYIIRHTASTSEGYETDSINNGILIITNKDEQTRQISGTFSFTAKKLMTNDTILISVTNGSFQGCY